jgi:hypothetical protein
MMDLVGGGVFAVAGLAVFFGGIALLMLIDGRGKAQERQFAHAERLKALEVGQPLPDAEVARARAFSQRMWAAGLTALFVPLGLGSAAVGATALVFSMASPHTHVTLLCVIWGICGVVSLTAVTTALGVMAAGRLSPTDKETPAEESARNKDPLATAFRASERVS